METENEKLINQELLREAEMIRQGRDRYQRQIKKNEEKGKRTKKNKKQTKKYRLTIRKYPITTKI